MYRDIYIYIYTYICKYIYIYIYILTSESLSSNLGHRSAPLSGSRVAVTKNRSSGGLLRGRTASSCTAPDESDMMLCQFLHPFCMGPVERGVQERSLVCKAAAENCSYRGRKDVLDLPEVDEPMSPRMLDREPWILVLRRKIP